MYLCTQFLTKADKMKIGTEYSLAEVMEFATLQERTNDAAEELEESFLEIQEKYKLSKKEVIFTLARLADSFIRMEEDYCFDESKQIDAEAIFNDYFLACRDIEEGDAGTIANGTVAKGN